MVKGKLSVSLIGAGNIAAGYDSPDDLHVLTHAHALKENSKFYCNGFYDVDDSKSRAASSKWGFPVIHSFQELLAGNPDLVVVCSPDHQHLPNLEQLVSQCPRFILCEKPLTLSYADSKSIASRLTENKIGLLVNYQRRFDDTSMSVKHDYLNGKFGRVVAANVLYSKGILHNGSHAVNFLMYLFGMPVGVLTTKKVFDFYPKDPTVCGVLFFESFVANFSAGDEKLFSVFEIDIVFETGRFRFTSSGNELEIYEVREDQLFAGYRELTLVDRKPTELRFAMRNVYEYIYQKLTEDSRGADTHTSDTLATQRICESFSLAELNKFQSLSNEKS